MRHTSSILLLAALLLAGGCATTPEDRIQQNPELFDSLNLVQQAQIRAGRVELGFTPDMVRLALGEPSRVFKRTTPAGETLVWQYQVPVYRSERQQVQLDSVSWRGAGGGRVSSGGTAWITVQQMHQQLQTHIEFSNGVATLIEQAENLR